MVFAHVRTAVGADWDALDASDPEVLAAVAGLRRECSAAKEALSHDTEVLVSVLLPGICTQVRLGRAEFEDMIRPAVQDTVAAMRRALDSARVSAAELGALLLVGGSSRIPLITQLVSEEFGRSAAVDVDPKGVIAAGAALAARAAQRARRPAGPVGRSAGPGGRSAGPGVRSAGPGVRSAGAGRPPVDAGQPGPVGPATGPIARSAGPVGPATGPLAGPVAAATGPLARSAAPVAGPSGAAHRPAAADPADDTGAVPTMRGLVPVGPAVRPPKQARPFAAVVDAPGGKRRRVAVGVAAGVLALVLLGGAVAFGATRIGANREADASTPPPTSIGAVSPAATASPVTEPPVVTSSPPPAPEPPARQPGRARVRPPVAPPTPAGQPPPTAAAPPTTTTVDPPQDEANQVAPDGDQNADDGANQQRRRRPAGRERERRYVRRGRRAGRER